MYEVKFENVTGPSPNVFEWINSNGLKLMTYHDFLQEGSPGVDSDGLTRKAIFKKYDSTRFDTWARTWYTTFRIKKPWMTGTITRPKLEQHRR